MKFDLVKAERVFTPVLVVNEEPAQPLVKKARPRGKNILRGPAPATDSREGLIEVVASKRGSWTVPALADLLSRSPGAIYEQIRAGKLPAIKIGTSISLCPKLTAEWLRKSLTN